LTTYSYKVVQKQNAQHFGRTLAGANPGLSSYAGMQLQAWQKAAIFCLAHSYLPSHRASLLFGQYQIILFGDIGTCVQTTFNEMAGS